MDLDHKATEDLAKMAIWLQDSLGYAREHGQRMLIWQLEAVRVEIKFEYAPLTLLLGGSPRLLTGELLREGGGRA